MSAPINHDVLIKKPYNVVKDLLEPHYINTSEEKNNYKHITSELVIILYSETPKETKVTISFPNQLYSVAWCDQQINRPIGVTEIGKEVYKKRSELAKTIQNTICRIYNLLNKKYYESNSIKLRWKNECGGLYFVYPQFVFEVTHNLPGKEFLHINSGFTAKINLNICDKTLYGKHGVLERGILYEIKMEFNGIKKENGVEIINSDYYQSHNPNMKILPEYIDKFEEWLNKTCATGVNKNNILCDFILHIVEAMKYNN